MKLIIDRKTWARGTPGQAKLLDEDCGYRCCLGFLAKECGIPDEALSSVKSFDQFYLLPGKLKWIKKVPQFLLDGCRNSDAAQLLMQANDVSLLHSNLFKSETEREEWLTKKFAEYDIELVFEN